MSLDGFIAGPNQTLEEPNADAWWGDEPPFHHPVFVLTHHEREPVTKEGGTTFTFVTDGIESALEQARAAAGDDDVAAAGGADVVQQYLSAGLFDEIQLHVVPVLLGDGVRLFDGPPPDPPRALELGRAATLEDVGHVAAFVASDRTRAMTGATANVSCDALVD